MSVETWKRHQIQIRAKELLEENPPKKMIPYWVMLRDVIATRREMNRIKRSRYR